MKGIIFNLVEEVVSSAYGRDTWDDLLDAAGLDGAYTSLGSYPDEDLTRLVGAASVALETPPDVVIRTIGEGAIPTLAARFPQFFQGHPSTISFVLTLNEIIHAEVRKLYPGADVPVFEFDQVSDEVLMLGYRSARMLCALAEGFLLGAATIYGERAELTQTECMLRGDERCLIRAAFSPASPR